MRRKISSNSSVASGRQAHTAKVTSHTTVRALPYPHAAIPPRRSVASSASLRPLVFRALGIISVVAIVLLSSTAIKLSIDSSIKSKEEMKEQLAIEKNFAQELLATKQYLVSEERIRSIAVSELGMEYNPATTPSIKVDISRIKEVEELVKSSEVIK